MQVTCPVNESESQRLQINNNNNNKTTIQRSLTTSYISDEAWTQPPGTSDSTVSAASPRLKNRNCRKRKPKPVLQKPGYENGFRGSPPAQRVAIPWSEVNQGRSLLHPPCGGNRYCWSSSELASGHCHIKRLSQQRVYLPGPIRPPLFSLSLSLSLSLPLSTCSSLLLLLQALSKLSAFLCMRDAWSERECVGVHL